MKIFQIPGHARSWMYLMRMNAHCKITRVGSMEHVKCIQQLAISWILYTEFLSYHHSNERANIAKTWNENLFECLERKR